MNPTKSQLEQLATITEERLANKRLDSYDVNYLNNQLATILDQLEEIYEEENQFLFI